MKKVRKENEKMYLVNTIRKNIGWIIAGFLVVLPIGVTSTVACTDTTVSTGSATPTPTATVTQTAAPTSLNSDTTDGNTETSDDTGEGEKAIDSVEGTRVDNIIDLKKGDFKDGDVCITRGFYYKGDGGEAVYDIVDNKQLVEDGFMVQTLYNGKKAVLRILEESNGQKRVNVLVAGILPEAKISSRLNNIISKTRGMGAVIQFNKGRYLIDKPVFFGSQKYEGLGDVQFYVTYDFSTDDDRIFTTRDEYVTSGQGLNLELSNITFFLETTERYSLLYKETILLCLTGVDSCKINNCKFIARQAYYKPTYAMVDLVWFRDSNTKNVEITNCSFENTTCQEPGTNFKGGGEIWFWGGEDMEYHTIQDVSIKNCKFVNTTNDEIIAVWGCVANNFVVDGCTFTVQKHHSDNIFAFNDMSFSDFVIKNSTFNLNTTCTYPIKTMKDTKAELLVDGCTFNLNNGVVSPWVENVSLMYFSNPQKSGETIRECMNRGQYDITNCKVYSKNGTQYRTVVTPKNVTVDVDNLYADANIGYGVAWIENCFADVDVMNSYLDMQNSSVANVKSVTGKSRLAITGCDIYENVLLYLAGSVALDYTLAHNTLSCTEQNFLIISSGKALTGTTSSMNIYDNEAVDWKKIYGYYGSTSMFSSISVALTNVE